MTARKKTRIVRVRDMEIGGGTPISVQSMTNIPAHDFAGAVKQIKKLEAAKCDIVRLAVPDTEAADIFTYARKEGVKCPLVADIHFDYKIALAALRAGADKIRINPGNIGEKWKVKEVANACLEAGAPIRIGVNSGSLHKELLKKYGAPTAEALAESALIEAESLENCGFSDIVISIKSSSVDIMTEAAKIISEKTDYPLHLGITEAGDNFSGLVRSSIGIGSLLLSGIGDTIRVSLTADPVEEVYAALEILNSLGLNKKGCISVVSCPTCGRTKVDLIKIGREYKEKIKNIDTNGKNLKIAVMGCAVNGPGEAKEADFGIAGGDGFVLFFRDGKPVTRIPEENAVDFLVKETEKAISE